MNHTIRKIYLYIITFVGIVISVIGSINLLDLGLKTFVFTKADSYVEYARPKMIDEQEEEIQVDQEAAYQKELDSRRQRQASSAISMIVIGVPLYQYHWHTLKKEK